MPPANTIEQVLAKLERGDHWIWTGSVSTNGYGQVAIGGRRVTVHVAVFEHLVGPVPEGLELDHLCRVRRYARPDHLEPVTHAENVRRARAHYVTCRHGHPYDYVDPKGARRCRTCASLARARYEERRAAAA